MDSYDLTALRKPMDVTSDGPYGEIRPHSALPLGTSGKYIISQVSLTDHADQDIPSLRALMSTDDTVDILGFH